VLDLGECSYWPLKVLFSIPRSVQS